MENLTPETRLEYYLDKIAAGGGSSSGGGIFKVMVTREEDSQTGSTIYTLDKNYTEITTALNNGMLPIFIEAFTEGDAYGYGFYYLCQYGFNNEYIVMIQTFHNLPGLTFVASEPTGVLHTEAET